MTRLTSLAYAQSIERPLGQRIQPITGVTPMMLMIQPELRVSEVQQSDHVSKTLPDNSDHALPAANHEQRPDGVNSKVMY